MKILVLVQAYPEENHKNLMYVHVRNKYYVEHGAEVVVLNFSAKETYFYEGIKVITEENFEKPESFDVLISHAPNIRNHYRFLKKYETYFPQLVFFFHGHEIMTLSKEYPKDYSYMKTSSGLRIKLQDIYDLFKCSVWKRYFLEVGTKSKFVFVSNYLKNCFFKYVKIDSQKLEGRIYVINNSVGKVFEEKNYCPADKMMYDFITIRSNLDGATYCVDLINKWAKENPEYKFLLIGKGKYFEFAEKAPNIDWREEHLTHEEMLDLINQSRVALMPTRHDTQGVMSCELATYGIPLITSNIDICKEIFSRYSNVLLMSNQVTKSEFVSVAEEAFNMKYNEELIDKHYIAADTLDRELALLF